MAIKIRTNIMEIMGCTVIKMAINTETTSKVVRSIPGFESVSHTFEVVELFGNVFGQVSAVLLFRGKTNNE
jgi:hypothetical protein